jgi:hypothetical protein
LQPDGACSFRDVSQRGFGVRSIGRIDQHGGLLIWFASTAHVILLSFVSASSDSSRLGRMPMMAALGHKIRSVTALSAVVAAGFLGMAQPRSGESWPLKQS